MVSLLSLWLPILLAAVMVFVASSIIHMFLPYHRSDWKKMSDEDGVMDALRGFNIPPGDYAIPNAGSPDVMKSEAFQEKARRGPVAFMTVLPAGDPFNMKNQLIQWFLYSILIAVFAGYIATRTVAPGEDYLQVFRVTGAVAFCCYSIGLIQRSIWYSQSWSSTMKSVFDGFVYALLTAGAFGSMWP